MRQEAELLQAIQREPGDALAWLALADCLEEQGEDARADLVRLREWLRFADLRDPQRPRNETRLQELLARGVPPTVPRRVFALSNWASLEMVLIPPGSFWMGSTNDEPERYSDEGPRHRVTLTQGFWMGAYPITQIQWREVMCADPAHFSDENHPVEQVSFNGWREFITRLRATMDDRPFAFPTEAEWEYACRSGTTTTFSSGKDEAALARAGWYGKNSGGLIQPVGEKVPNAWGLHDMHGGVWEWCRDGLRTYGKDAVTDPVGTPGSTRVLRGGSYRNEPRAVRCAHRGVDTVSSHLGPLGCRVVLPLESGR